MKFREYMIEAMNKRQLKFIAKKVEATKWMDDILMFIRKPPTTWFDVEFSDNNQINLTTRRHGDVANERAGKEDIKEGRRLAKVLQKKFSKVAKISLDSVDEWVMVDIIKK